MRTLSLHLTTSWVIFTVTLSSSIINKVWLVKFWQIFIHRIETDGPDLQAPFIEMNVLFLNMLYKNKPIPIKNRQAMALNGQGGKMLHYLSLYDILNLPNLHEDFTNRSFFSIVRLSFMFTWRVSSNGW